MKFCGLGAWPISLTQIHIDRPLIPPNAPIAWHNEANINIHCAQKAVAGTNADLGQIHIDR